MKHAAPAAAQDRDAAKKQEANDLVVETIDALFEERNEGETIWGSMVKQAVKRRKPGSRCL